MIFLIDMYRRNKFIQLHKSKYGAFKILNTMNNEHIGAYNNSVYDLCLVNC